MFARIVLVAALYSLFAGTLPVSATDLKILQPLGRKAYQTNERIDLAVIRDGGGAALAAGSVILTLQGADVSRLSFTFPVARVAPAAGTARSVEHLHINGWLVCPGKYIITAACDGAEAKDDIEVYTHIRRSSFRLINWGRAKDKAQLSQGEDNLGFNLFYGHYGQDTDGNFIRAGVDFMSNCTMSGGHQMDLRQECDWSDPYVIRGGSRRVANRAFLDRTRPNVPGVHFYDEPGLTWMKHPVTGKDSPQAIPSQLRSYEAAFGAPPLPDIKVNVKNPEDVRRWAHWARWKLGFMDAAWKDAQFAVSYVRPDFLSVTQSQYGWSAFTDGYYFNVVRSLPIISGHGGYHDYGPGYFNPSYFLELARGRDLARPNWYLPTWYGNTTSDEFRLEQYLSFQTNLQGMISPPDLEPGEPEKCKAAAGIVESNKLMGRLGPIFTTMSVSKPPVAMLYSLSQMIHAQTQNPEKVSYAHDTSHGRNLTFAYLAGKLLQQPFLTVLDEDILDGTLAADHKAIVITSLDYLDPQVIAGLEAFARRGGLVMMTGDCAVKIQGAINLGVRPGFPDAERIAALEKAGNSKEAAALTRTRQALHGAAKLAEAIKPHLIKAGINPVFASSEAGITATRQAAGDIEYLFAVNATHDPQGDAMLGIKTTTATLGLEADGRPVYDAVRGGPIKEFAVRGKVLEAQFRFGPGQMRVFARTARPIGSVKAAAPVLHRDYTQQQAPIRLDIAAALLDAKGGLLSGSAPLRIRLIDPQGNVRYDLYRATDRGTLRLSLPLALNDPAGRWTLKVTELLAGSEDTATVMVSALPTCNAAAGASWRAVHLAQDRDNVFRFFRTHQYVMIVKGSSPYNDAAARRLVTILKPWNVKAAVITAEEASKPRSLSHEEAATWIGLNFAGKGQIKPGDENDPAQVGFAVEGPAILLGTPEDNPLIKVLQAQQFLPYAPSKAEMPGPGRGLIAWQFDGIGVNQESLTLIAYDGHGMSEAVGTMFEMMAGIEPLTPLQLAQESSITPAQGQPTVPEPAVAWSIVLPDRVTGLKVNGDRSTVLTHDGTLSEVAAGGNVTSTSVLDAPAYRKAATELGTVSPFAALAAGRKYVTPQQLVKFGVTNGGLNAVAYWGGTIHVVDQAGVLRAAQKLPQDVTAMAWSGAQLLVGDADGRLMALRLSAGQ
jgi:hypothetical protein